MLNDIDIASMASPLPIYKIAKKLGIEDQEIEFFGKYKAKLNEKLLKRLENKKKGKLILVTAINPTPAGEGKTTTTIGLGQAMAKIGKNAIIALREPSLGPVFGVKGGATGGGYAQVLPMDEINLHFTGDLHAVTAANNLLCCMVDNHIYQGNKLKINPKTVLIRRCLDMNDRALRDITINLGTNANKLPKEDGFIITVASEVMAIICLARSLNDLKFRLGEILVGYKFDETPVFAKDIGAAGAMTALLKDAIFPNLVQTLEGTPALIHGGPFANIAHGCNSIKATELALSLADYCITEAGFGADLGAEKFFNIKCRIGNLSPNAVVLVATTRALKYNGGMDKNSLIKESISYLSKGICNLEAHITNLKKFNVPVIVALNRFSSDTNKEIEFIQNYCENLEVDMAISDVFSKGGEGGKELAKLVCTASERKSFFKCLYPLEISIKEKVQIIAKEIYGADNILYTSCAEKSIIEIEKLQKTELPVCIAKTQYSLSDKPSLLGKPSEFTVTVRDVKLSNGAGFIVVLLGDIMTMPGLPKIPAAEIIDVDENGKISGLF
ncbi:MAG: formate--tetrahydrofolate ligase [Oscillospiraceae bacterium]|jgi:formate--tetrahydrofolate ligase|nr:formate--tetrahydrofolate ligase [Oscillospiraceae bacterium]